MICKICNQEITENQLKPYRKRNGEISYRKNCKSCYNKRNNTYESTIRSRKTRKRSSYKYVEIDTTDLIFITETKLRKYWVSKQGIIYSQCKSGLKEVEKRLGSRGYLEFKIGNKTANYKRVVAESLVKNDCNGNFVYSKNGDIFDTRPENLKWVWTRNGQRLTEIEAANRCHDEKLKQAYLINDKKYISRIINNHFERIYKKFNPDLIGDLYLKLTEYADRNLIFDIKKDSIQTYYGLKKQQRRKKLKTISLDSFNAVDKTNFLYDKSTEKIYS